MALPHHGKNIVPEVCQPVNGAINVIGQAFANGAIQVVAKVFDVAIVNEAQRPVGKGLAVVQVYG